MRDVRGYEEKDPAVTKHLTSGYPRFVVHPFARQLGAYFLKSDPALAGRALWLTSSERMALALNSHLAGAGEARLFSKDGLHGVSHHDGDADVAARAKVFLQNLGGFLSSREAEDQLVRLGLIKSVHAEELFVGDSAGEVCRHLRRALNGATDSDLFITNCGMSAVWTTFQAIAEIQAARGRTIWLQMGWLYLDTIAILKKFTRTANDYVYIRDVFDLDALARIFAAHGHRIAGVVAEVPTNPLIQTPDLPELAALCRRHGARLVVDPSISSVFNLDVLPHCDVVVSSLTKYTASEGDLTAGLIAINSASSDAAELRSRIAKNFEPLYSRDLARLAWQIGRTEALLAKIHENTSHVARFLATHPAVKEVYWAHQTTGRENYDRIARAPDATGGMITFTLRRLGSLTEFYDRLRLPKGPSFGMKTTLICPFMYLAHYDLVTTPTGLAELAASKLDPDLLRLCVGAESVDDIIDALSEALG